MCYKLPADGQPKPTHKNQNQTINFLKYYYNHFKTNTQGKNPLQAITDDEMGNFKRISSTCNEHNNSKLAEMPLQKR